MHRAAYLDLFPLQPLERWHGRWGGDGEKLTTAFDLYVVYCTRNFAASWHWQIALCGMLNCIESSWQHQMHECSLILMNILQRVFDQLVQLPITGLNAFDNQAVYFTKYIYLFKDAHYILQLCTMETVFILHPVNFPKQQESFLF